MSSDSKSNARNKTKTRNKRKKASGKKRGRKTNLERKIINAELISTEELNQLTKDNSFLLSPSQQNAWFQKDMVFAMKRAAAAEMLHDHLFDPMTMKGMEDKTLVALYSTMLKDLSTQKAMNIKLAELKENSAIKAGLIKMYQDQEKRKEIEGQDTSHVGSIVQTLLDESMRHALDDQMIKLYQGSNSYRPEESRNYDIIALDENADD